MDAVPANRYTQVPVNVAPDVPHYVNLALREIGLDMALQIVRLNGTAAEVTEKLAGKELVYTNNPRVPDMGDPDAFHVMNKDGGVPFRVEGDSTWVGDTECRPTAGEHFTLESLSGHLLLDVDPATGRVYAPNLHADTLTLPGAPAGSGTPVSRVVLLVMAGQSNGEGRGKPYSAELDPVDPRISMYDWRTGTLTPATVPLSSQQQQTGISPATVIARETLLREPPGTQIVILNAAAGGSGLLAEPSQGTWAIDYAGARPRLYSVMMGKLRDTLELIKMDYPGIALEVRFFWHQGEADAGTAPDLYAAKFDELVSAVRTGISRPDMTVTLGGVVSDNNPITAVHQQTPARLTRTAYAPGVPNGGGSASTTDTVHYHREGVEVLGRGMYDAYRRALVNVPASVPVPPLAVEASLAGDTLHVRWSVPFCRVTSYAVQYSVNGGDWAAVPARPVPLEPSAMVPGIPAGARVRVRMATKNDAGTSAFTTIIEAGA